VTRLLLKKLVQKRKSNGDLSRQLVTVLEPSGVGSEAYHTLRTKFLYALGEKPRKAVVITSSGPKEGKSITCANLGAALAQAGKNTLIIDCDLRMPTMDKIFKLSNSQGLVDILTNEADLPEVWQEPLPDLRVVTAGSLPPQPTALLDSNRFTELLDQVRQTFDYVLVDTPPVEVVADAMICAAQCDGVLLVLDQQETRKRAVLRSVRSLRAVDADILALVVNNVAPPRGGYSDKKQL
jgi:receptor protein-tyrosine kinase